MRLQMMQGMYARIRLLTNQPDDVIDEIAHRTADLQVPWL
jgi:hypothetical protein